MSKLDEQKVNDVKEHIKYLKNQSRLTKKQIERYEKVIKKLQTKCSHENTIALFKCRECIDCGMILWD